MWRWKSPLVHFREAMHRYRNALAKQQASAEIARKSGEEQNEAAKELERALWEVVNRVRNDQHVD